jgi:hypothetical protein
VLVELLLKSARSVWPSMARRKMQRTSKKALLLPVLRVYRDRAGVLVGFSSFPATSRMRVMRFSCSDCAFLVSPCLETDVLMMVVRCSRSGCAEVMCALGFGLFI